MKRILFKLVFCLQIIFLANRLSAQDIIVLKNGDEIKSKVVEVTPDLVKYKKWDNQEGPIYSSNKSEVFMIKYQNGSKDVFKIQESSRSNEVTRSDEDSNNKLSQESAGQTIAKFASTNASSMYKTTALSTPLKIEPVIQFSENEASIIVHYNFKDSYTNERLVVKYVFKKNIDKKWFLTSLSPIAGIGSQPLADDLNKFQDINMPVLNYGSTQNNIVNNNISTKETVIEIKGITYKTIAIGTQTWMAENLKTTKYNDGTDIPLITDNLDWTSSNAGYCVYDNYDAKYKDSYGILYNWYAVNTGKLCPIGWHVPSDIEWKVLNDFLGDEYTGGAKLKEIGTSHWISPNVGATNETGFTAYPGGYRSHVDGTFSDIGRDGYWWSATASGSTSSWYRSLSYDFRSLGRNDKFHNESGLSVRCIKNN